MKAFISYSSEDIEFCSAIIKFCENEFGDKCQFFRAENSIIGGQDWKETIRTALSDADFVIGVLTSNSILRPWVIAELGYSWVSKKKSIILCTRDVKISSVPDFLSQKQFIYVENTEKFTKEFVEAINLSMGLIYKFEDKTLRKWAKLLYEKSIASMGPLATANAWNRALEEGDVEVYERLTSKKSENYIKNKWGTLDKLSQQYKNSIKNRSASIDIEETISETRDWAMAKYAVAYQDERNIVEWIDILVFEEGIWKIRPEFVVHRAMKSDSS